MHIGRENNNSLIQIDNECKHKTMKSLWTDTTLLNILAQSWKI